MAEDTQNAASGSKTDTAGDKTTNKPDYLSSIPIGSLIGSDWSKEPELELRESQTNAIKDLLKKLMKRDMPARREEVIRVWEAELFWRGYQHLLPSRSGFGWEFPDRGSGYGRGESGHKSMFETNFFLSYGRSVVSALSRKIPTVRFVPICPQSDVDITSADAANKLTGVITRNNNMLGLQAEMARFLYTDGRASFYTRYVKDGQRFGFKDDEDEDEEELVPETEGKPATGEGQGSPSTGTDNKETNSDEGEKPTDWPEPCGREVITVHGALEVKYPIKANYQSEIGWLLWCCERDLPVAKGMYPKNADKIKISAGGPAGDDIDRLARINTKLGVEDSLSTSDSEAYEVTIQNAWLRDCSLLEIQDEETRQDLLEMSKGKGLRFTFCGEELISAKRESLDDHWTLIQADAGDGIHRNSLGGSYIPLQKIVNTLLELANDYFVHGVPMKWMDNETFDVEHIQGQTNTPGGIRPFVADPTRPAAEMVFIEPTIQFPQGLAEMIDAFGPGQTAQIITGVFPALSGDDVGNADTGIAMKLQRDAALGRLGIPWRNIKEGMASVFLQAVQCLATNHDEDIITSGLKAGASAIMVELQDLKGKYYCEPDTDENFPESFTEIQARVEDLVEAMQANPAIGEIVNSPENYDFIKRSTGLTELVIPKGVSYQKQLGEIEELKKSGPLPNPAIDQAKKQLAQLTAQAATDPQAAQQVQALQQQMAQLPPTVSSVEIDNEVDDHSTEAETCLNFLRGTVGRAMKSGMDTEQQAYQNIKQHYMAHAQAAQKVAEANKKPPAEKGISKTVSVGDLVKAGVPPDQALKMIESI